MRTKTLLLTAVLSAAGIAASLAQGTVYSVNAVGYVNKTLVPGFQLIANPLNNTAANGNTIGNLFQAVPDGTTLYKFNPATSQFSGNSFDFGAWASPGQTLVPGEGAFIFIPGSANVTVTFVGDVMQGTTPPLTTQIPRGFSIAASQVPLAGLLQTDLGYVPSEGDTVYVFNAALQKYEGRAYEFGAWSLQPNLEIGQSVFINSVDAKTWTKSFTVNN